MSLLVIGYKLGPNSSFALTHPFFLRSSNLQVKQVSYDDLSCGRTKVLYEEGRADESPSAEHGQLGQETGEISKVLVTVVTAML